MATFLLKLTSRRQHVTFINTFLNKDLGTGATTLLNSKFLNQSQIRLQLQADGSSWTSFQPLRTRYYQETRPVFNTNFYANASAIDKLTITDTCVHFKSDFTKYTRTQIFKTGGPELPTLQQLTSQETFEDYRIIYRDKSSLQLLSALFFFLLCRFSFITDNSVKIMNSCYKVLGKRLSELLIRKAAYDQFVAGEGIEELKMVAAKLRQGGVASIVCVPIETDEQAVNCESTREQYLDSKLRVVLESIQMAAQLGDTFPMTQFRISALFAGDLLKAVSHFCEQTIHDSQVMEALIGAMFGHHVDFSQLPGWKNFPQERNEEFMKGLRRMGMIKDAMENQDVIALIDAEYSSINPSLRLLCLYLMKVCNTDYAKIFSTYQAYFKTMRSKLEEDLEFAAINNFGFGLKLVRGAYLVTERQFVPELGHKDDLYESFEKTSANYHDCVDLLLRQVAEKPPKSIRFMVASHNEDSMRHVMARMAAFGIPNDGPSVFFGQLYGMADHVSFTLGHHGYRVHKSVPFGPVMESLPYLSRRAQENKAIFISARRERKLVVRALGDRIKLSSLSPKKHSHGQV